MYKINTWHLLTILYPLCYVSWKPAQSYDAADVTWNNYRQVDVQMSIVQTVYCQNTWTPQYWQYRENLAFTMIFQPCTDHVPVSFSNVELLVFSTTWGFWAMDLVSRTLCIVEGRCVSFQDDFDFSLKKCLFFVLPDFLLKQRRWRQTCYSSFLRPFSFLQIISGEY